MIEAIHADIVAATAAGDIGGHDTICREKLESRLAEVFSHLALVELSRKSARQREIRHRVECLGSTQAASQRAAPFPRIDERLEPNASKVEPKEIDSANTISLTHGARTEEGTLPGIDGCWATTACFLNLARQDVRKMRLSASRFAATLDDEISRRLRDNESHLRTIDKLQRRLLEERAKNKDLHQQAVEKGVCALSATKRVALEAKENLLAERAAAQRDSLRDMREYVASSLHRRCLSQHSGETFRRKRSRASLPAQKQEASCASLSLMR